MSRGRLRLTQLGPDDDDVGHLVNWLQSMQTRTQPNATVDHGFSHALVCIMAAQSYWSGKKTLLGSAQRTDRRSSGRERTPPEKSST
jgi:hypothetical protein